MVIFIGIIVVLPRVLSRPGYLNSHGPFFSPCRPHYISTGFFVKKNIFQSTHLTRKFAWDLLRLKLEILNTKTFRLVLGLMRGYKYSYRYRYMKSKKILKIILAKQGKCCLKTQIVPFIQPYKDEKNYCRKILAYVVIIAM